MLLNLLVNKIIGKKETHPCNNPLLVAHRGAPGYDTFEYAKKTPSDFGIWENTLSAFKNAVRNKAKAIEMDIHLTKDDEIIIIHDKTIDRTTNATGKISDYTTEQLQHVFTNKNFDEHLPKLDSVFEEFKDNVNYIIEIKPLKNKIKTQLIISKMLSLIEKHNLKNNCFVISFYPQPLLMMKNNRLKIPTGLIVYKKFFFSRLLLSLAFILGVDSINCFYKNLDNKLVKKIRKAGYKIGTWTVNDKVELERIMKLKIDYITSDFYYTTK